MDGAGCNELLEACTPAATLHGDPPSCLDLEFFHSTLVLMTPAVCGSVRASDLTSGAGAIHCSTTDWSGQPRRLPTDSWSANPAIGLLGDVGRQCAGYLPLSRCWLSMTACRFRLQLHPVE